MPPPEKRLVLFGPFSADLDSQELLRGDIRLRIPGQSFRILALLLAKPGTLVTRDEMRQELWPSDTFVDFDQGLSSAVNRLRDALGDSADEPRYIETLPRRGYRFIGKTEEAGINASPHLEALASAIPLEKADASTGQVRRLRRWMIFVFGFVLVAAVLAVAFVVGRSRTDSPAASVQPAVVPFTSSPGIETAPAFSPDGSRIAFSWSGNSDGNAPGYDLYVKGFGSEAELQLTHHPSSWICSAWSPDGTRIAFHRLAGKETGIYLVSAMGGPERKLIATRTPYDVAAPISWSPDGKWIAFNNQATNEPLDRMFRVSVASSEVIPFEHDPACLHEGSPTFSHDGQTIFYACVHSMYSGDVRSIPITGGTPTQQSPLAQPAIGIVLSGDGQRLVYFRPFGSPEMSVLDLNHHSVRQIDVPGDSGWPTLSVQGDKLAFSADLSRIGIWKRDLVHPDAPAVSVIPSSRHQNSPQYSPDGKHIAFESMRGGDWALWVADADGENPVKVSAEVVGSGAPRWSPDGTKIAFDAAASNPSSIYIVDVSEGVPRKLQTDLADMKLPTWSHDGGWIYFTSDSQVGHRVFRCRPQGGKTERLPTDEHSTRPEESADGKYLYVTSREVHFQLKKISLSEPNAQSEIAAIPRILHWTLWQPTPGGIYFVPSEAPRTMRYFEFVTGKTKDLFTLEKDFGDGFGVSPDGRYMLYSQMDEKNSDIMVMDKYH